MKSGRMESIMTTHLANRTTARLHLFPAALALVMIALLSACAGGDNSATHDSGTGTADMDTDADTDSDTDSDSDSGCDAGPELVDPEIDWVAIDAGTFTFGSPEGTTVQGCAC
jgi:hypothetical protein